MKEKQRELELVSYQSGASLVGFGDISSTETEFTPKYPVAVCLAIELDKTIVKRLDKDENTYHLHLQNKKESMKRIVTAVKNQIQKWGHQSYSAPVSITIMHQEQLENPETFSHKTAAASAGLGWIGKSSLLITPQYGPRVLLGTVLTAATFKTGRSYKKDLCGACSLCVGACPHDAIKNVNWAPGMGTEALVDMNLCNEKRLEYMAEIGRKHACGLCMKACKVGSFS